MDRLEDLGIMQHLRTLLAENTAAMDDLQFNPVQVDVLTNVVGCLSEVLKIQVFMFTNVGSKITPVLMICCPDMYQSAREIETLFATRKACLHW